MSDLIKLSIQTLVPMPLCKQKITVYRVSSEGEEA